MNKMIKNKMLPSRQKAFTLVELMIAGTLGLLLIAGVIQLFVGSNQNFTLQSELADVQEDGRFSLMFLENEIQQAGWYDDNFNFSPDSLTFVDPGIAGRTANSDFVTITYQLVGDGNDRDCNGNTVADGLITNTFYLGGAGGEELLCRGNGGVAGQPLIDGVIDFQVLYGVETNAACPDGAVNQYMTGAQVLAINNANASLEDNLIVASVRVALLMASEKDVLAVNEAETHYLLDTVKNTNTKRAYRTFQQTIYMPNAFFSRAGDPAKGPSCLASRVGT